MATQKRLRQSSQTALTGLTTQLRRGAVLEGLMALPKLGRTPSQIRLAFAPGLIAPGLLAGLAI